MPLTHERIDAATGYCKDIRLSGFPSVFLRFALALSSLSAVVDRFGLWGNCPGRCPSVSCTSV